MKKLLVLGLLSLCILTGCTKEVEKGNYKEGTYFGSVEAESYGKKYYTTAVVYVDDFGMIKSVFLDNTYFKDDKYTTKKILGDEYGMKSTSASAGVIEGGAEWYEQAAVIEKKVISEQGLNWVKYSDDAKTKLDGVSGVTITANTYVDAINKALDSAK
ncbi:MAG: hypothetical protein RSB77_02660 [Bacilli bacterium]